MATTKVLPVYKTVNGLILPKHLLPSCIESAMNYKPRDDDVFIVTYPKCGTTWTQYIVWLIYKKGRPYSDTKEFFASAPFLEMLGAESAEMMTRPGAIKIHFPFHLTPYSPNAKYIYVVRNPKDCCVSMFHHERLFPGFDFEDGKFDDFFDLFIDGQVEWGDYFDHLVGWYKRKDDPNVFFTTYEAMKKDTRGVVMGMAEFLGAEYREMLEKDPDVMDNILRYSSFKHMKENDPMKIFLECTPEDAEDPSLPDGIREIMKYQLSKACRVKRQDAQFIRKGVVGDWRSHFSEEQSRRMDERFAEKMRGTDMSDWWMEEMAL